MKAPLLALLASVVYATARYNIFKGVPWTDWPTYTLNKALALASIVLIVRAVIRKGAPKGPPGGALSMASVFAGMHVLLSLTLLNPVYYATFFVQGKLTAAAGVSMMLGAVAAAAMVLGKRAPGDQDVRRRGRSLALLALVVGLHALLQGFAGWFTPWLWPGAMPPITLISFLLGLAAVAIAFRPKRSARHTE